MNATTTAKQTKQIEAGIALRKVRAQCPVCGGDVADKVQIEAGKTVGTRCRCCLHVWNIRNVRKAMRGAA